MSLAFLRVRGQLPRNLCLRAGYCRRCARPVLFQKQEVHPPRTIITEQKAVWTTVGVPCRDQTSAHVGDAVGHDRTHKSQEALYYRIRMQEAASSTDRRALFRNCARVALGLCGDSASSSRKSSSSGAMGCKRWTDGLIAGTTKQMFKNG